ncbi:MAG: indole-3-glycerol phosphate synthase [Actinomycetia bacterium]|nr:indole-3-glycerol phosphate synthase [Actinomycetes bacterium]
MSVLDDILATKRDEVTILHQPQARDAIRKAALDAPPIRSFPDALRRADGRVAVIGEIKRRSPSKGDLAPDLDAADTARAYAAGGAAALSVLTDAPYFGGSVLDLMHAREAVDIPVLRKDFTIDDIQVYEARGIGADAILLIAAAIPDDAQLADLHSLALDLGLGVLVEVHDDAELDRALAIGAAVVGVNSRDLGSFVEDLGVAETIAARIPAGSIAVAESAIRSPDDVVRMAGAGFDAVLVGEALVRSEDPTATMQAFAGVDRRDGGR